MKLGEGTVAFQLFYFLHTAENDVLVPDNPSVSFMVAPDRRYGYWNHAEIKMTWMLPTSTYM